MKDEKKEKKEKKKNGYLLSDNQVIIESSNEYFCFKLDNSDFGSKKATRP